MKPSLPLQNSGTHPTGLEDLGKNGGLPEIKLPVNGCSEIEESFNILQNKELKQEPLDDPTCIDTSETSLSNQNKLFSDINLNDQEWQELIDELANTVPEDDIQDLFNEDFEEKKEPEFPRPATEIQESASIKSDPSHSPFAHVPLGSPQRMTPPMANPNKNPMMPYIQPQSQQPQMQAQMAHLSEEQKRMLIMKQKGMMTQPMAYATLPSLSQEQHQVGLSRTTGPMQPSVPPGSSNVVTGTSPGGPSFLGNQPQAAIMKQMLIEQRAQLHVIEQQKQQFLREQRQQQQILAEQLQQQSHLPRQHLQQQRTPYPVQQVNQFQGSPQDIAAVRNQAALQSMRTSRMMAQSAGMMAMAPSQNPGTMSTAAGQSEMGMAPYSNTSTSQTGMYSMSTGMSQMLQHPNQSGMNMAHNAGQGPRQPVSGQGVGMISSFGQNMLVNSAIPQHQQQMKGPVGQILPRPQAPRLQNIMGTVPQGTQNWQQRGLQGIPGRTTSEMGPFNNGTTYPMQPGQPRLPKQHFPQGINQSVVDTTGTVRGLNPAMGRQMLQPLPGQQGTSQARPVVLPAISQGVPTMSGFSQPSAQQMPGGNFAQSSQGQAYERNPTQDMSYNYSGEGAGGSFSSLAEGADLVDSIIKGGPGDEWMQELDELFGNP
ncbi:mastermind-like protein 3 isoform A [Alligator mississippiensis]|uniref:Mastermind-like protein 3 isoform A n=1 Tax=Alligator mississippiensis TaxID=8496 RepID=A0A151NHC1_ALLMI|nr:mastermind-like protein 3 isoform A [Alligator mississippiensis]